MRKTRDLEATSARGLKKSAQRDAATFVSDVDRVRPVAAMHGRQGRCSLRSLWQISLCRGNAGVYAGSMSRLLRVAGSAVQVGEIVEE